MRLVLSRLTATVAVPALFLMLLLSADIALAKSKVSKRERTRPQTLKPAAIPKVLFAESQRLRVFAIRLRPGQDLLHQLEEFVKDRKIKAGFIMTAVGSLRVTSVRLADQKEATPFTGKFEIVSLVGTLGQDGVHLHISISDSAGKTLGGHLVEGCLIYTTAEIVIADAQGITFSRTPDMETGYEELMIRSSKK